MSPPTPAASPSIAQWVHDGEEMSAVEYYLLNSVLFEKERVIYKKSSDSCNFCPDEQGVLQSFRPKGDFFWHLTLLPSSHQQLCHTDTSCHEEERQKLRDLPEHQRSQTAQRHCLQWSRGQSRPSFQSVFSVAIQKDWTYINKSEEITFVKCWKSRAKGGIENKYNCIILNQPEIHQIIWNPSQTSVHTDE